MDTKRVGIVGIENSHAEEIIRYLNVAQPEHVPVRIVALVSGEDERTDELARLGDIKTVVSDAHELMGEGGRSHRDNKRRCAASRSCCPFLESEIRAGWTSLSPRPCRTQRRSSLPLRVAARR